MGGLLEKTMDLFGFGGYEEGEYEEEMAPENPHARRSDDQYSQNRKKITQMPTSNRINVMILSPNNFDDAQDIADNIKQKRPCVVNLESVDAKEARRIVDFLSGAVYTADGSIQKVSNGIFLVAPYNVNVQGGYKEQLSGK
jgi:cell division inhibitor SepF